MDLSQTAPVVTTAEMASHNVCYNQGHNIHCVMKLSEIRENLDPK